MFKKSEIFWLLFFSIVGLLLRLNNLSSRSLWTDEFYTYFNASGNGVSIANFIAGIASAPKPTLLKAGEVKVFLKSNPDKTIKDVTAGLLRNDTHPPFYFWVMFYWLRCFGESVFSVRFFSLLAGILSIPLAYLLSRYLFNEGAAIFTALFVSISAFCVRYSQEGRSYSLAMSLALLSCLLVLKLEKDNRGGGNIFWLAFVNALGILTHYFYALIVISQFIYCTFAHRKNSAALDKFYLAFLLSLLLLSPWYILVAINGYQFYLVEWAFGYPGFSDRIYGVLLGIGRYIILPQDYRAPAAHLFLLAAAFLLLGLVFTALREAVRNYRRSLMFCLTMFLVPLGGMFLVDLIQHGILLKQERFWAFTLPGLMSLIGYCLYCHFLKNRLFIYCLIAAMLVFSVLAAGVMFGPAAKEASLWINRESAGGKAAVIVYNARSAVFPQAYYLDGDIVLIPVATCRQFDAAIQAAAGCADKVFIARHYYRADASLINPAFMESSAVGAGLLFKASIQNNDVSVSEYLNAHHKRQL